MAHPIHHAETSVKIFGGATEDYLPLHHWLDASKCAFADYRHRYFRHHRMGVKEAINRFIPGPLPKNIVKAAAEQHIMEDCGGRVPEASDWYQWLKAPPEVVYPLTSTELLEVVRKRFGQSPEPTLPVVRWFLQAIPIRCNAMGIFAAEEHFGVLTGDTPTRYIGEALVKALFGRVPTLEDWASCIRRYSWMANNTTRVGGQPRNEPQQMELGLKQPS